MNTPVKWLTENLAVCPQISPEQVPELAAMGFKSIVCNRPDDEYGPGQPKADEIAAKALEQGLAYAFLPVTPDGGTASDAKEMGRLLAELPQPVLAYCRTGNRCVALISLSARMGFAIP